MAIKVEKNVWRPGDRAIAFMGDTCRILATDGDMCWVRWDAGGYCTFHQNDLNAPPRGRRQDRSWLVTRFRDAAGQRVEIAAVGQNQLYFTPDEARELYEELGRVLNVCRCGAVGNEHCWCKEDAE